MRCYPFSGNVSTKLQFFKTFYNFCHATMNTSNKNRVLVHPSNKTTLTSIASIKESKRSVQYQIASKPDYIYNGASTMQAGCW
jgi:hypothetical protein